MSGRHIEVDDEVFAFLQKHSEPLIDTPNDVLRRLLLGSAPPSAPAGTRRPGALASLITKGLIAPGDRLVHEQPRRHIRHEATVTADGWIELPDGRAFAVPSRALGAQTGVTINGWLYTHEPSGKSLFRLRAEADQH